MAFLNFPIEGIGFGGTEVITSARVLRDIASGSITGALTVGTTLGVTGDTTLSGDLSVAGTGTFGTLAIPFTGARVYRTTAQSIPDSTYTAIEWNAETFDTDSFHDTVTNPERFTIPAGQGGVYRIEAAIRMVASAAGRVIVRFRKNGTTDIGYELEAGDNANDLTSSGLDRAQLAAGDYVEVMVFQDSGGAVNTKTGEGFVFASMRFEGTI